MREVDAPVKFNAKVSSRALMKSHQEHIEDQFDDV